MRYSEIRIPDRRPAVSWSAVEAFGPIRDSSNPPFAPEPKKQRPASPQKVGHPRCREASKNQTKKRERGAGAPGRHRDPFKLITLLPRSVDQPGLPRE